uniref:G_PROTEIN_RECEP_F1_2 domain-containing protein n=1 Tax=Rhabditophanes sp. KR3021 TaxID=114890 RepID=A0AC35U3X6_9BILA
MATLRYIVVNGNSSSKINWNSYKASAGFSLLAVIISFIGSAPNMIRYEVFDNGVVSLPRVCTDINAEYRDHFIGNNITHVQAYQLIRPSFWSCSWERIAHWFVGIILKFIPCILLTVFMSLLVRILIEARERRNRLCAARTVTCNTKTQAERTTAMLTIIVAVFLITELPQGIYVFMNGLFPSTHIIASKLGNFFDLLSLLNSSINFILYSTMSHQFRSNFIDMIAKYIPKTIERISGNQTIATTAVTAKSNKSKNGKDKDTTSKVQLLAISSTKCSQDNSSASKMQEFSNTTFTETQPPPTCEDYEGYFNERNEISWKRKGFQPLVYFYIILGLCGFLSNLLIIAVFCKTKKLRNTRNFYIINLAVTDLLTSCISAPATMYATMYTFWPWDNYYSCKFFTCFQTLNMFTSCFTLVLISLDTFFLTYYPLDWPTKKYIHILLYIGVWLLALLITAPYIMAISLDYDYNLLSMNETEIYNLIEDCPKIIPLKICGESETIMDDIRKAEEQRFIPSDSDTPSSVAGITKDILDARTRVKRKGDNIIYLFDYRKNLDDPNSKTELLNRQTLKALLKARDWELLKHPFVLNFINEKLIKSATSYATHCLIYFVFLILLYTFVVTQPNFIRSFTVSCFLAFFLFFMFLKFLLKQIEKEEFSTWFAISFLFNLFTYLTTALYVWHYYIFSMDDYHEEVKILIAWFLPIISVISAWINFLYVLRKSPFGLYILMMKRILITFFKVSVIWVPTIVAFSFAFQLVMKDTGTEPWDDKAFANNTLPFMAVLQSLTKTSAMMVGELDADNFLERKQWMANILLILFEVFTVILLMNLLISLAVGDVNELRYNAEGTLLKIKLNYCLETMHISEFLPGFSALFSNDDRTNNVLVIVTDAEESWTLWDGSVKIDKDETRHIEDTKHFNWQMDMGEGGVRILQKSFNHRNKLFMLSRGSITMNETFGSGIMEFKSPVKKEYLFNPESHFTCFKRWLISINWNSLMLN